MSSLSTAQVAFLNNITQPENIALMPLQDALNDVQSGRYKAAIQAVRHAGSYEAQKKLKLGLPTIHFNGAFKDRLTNENLTASSGLFHFDIDNLNTDKEGIELKRQLATLPECVFCFVSPSGLGVKGALRIADDRVKNDADFKSVFAYCDEFFKKLGITIDPSCKDVRRACFMSSDADIYINYDADVLYIPEAKQQQEQPKQKQSEHRVHSAGNQDTASICIERVQKIFNEATDGTRHDARLRAGNLAGGYIAGGLIDEKLMLDVLEQLSDSVADNGATDKSELKTIHDAVIEGMKTPINNLGRKELSMANRIEPFSAINFEPLFQRKINYSALISVDSFPLPA